MIGRDDEVLCAYINEQLLSSEKSESITSKKHQTFAQYGHPGANPSIFKFTVTTPAL
jgi:hypothetical protein